MFLLFQYSNVDDWLHHLVVECGHMMGKGAMLVNQEAESSLLLQQCLLATFGNVLLHVHLAGGEGLYTLQDRGERSHQLSTA